MKSTIKRPASVWIAQVLLVVFALMLLLPLLTLLFTFGVPVRGFVVAVAINLAIVSLLIVAFWGMVRRRQYGRWISVGMLSLMLLLSIVGQIVRPSGPLQYYEYENATEAAAGLMTQVLISGLFLWLILALAFGKRSASFFSGKDLDAPVEIFPK